MLRAMTTRRPQLALLLSLAMLLAAASPVQAFVCGPALRPDRLPLQPSSRRCAGISLHCSTVKADGGSEGSRGGEPSSSSSSSPASLEELERLFERRIAEAAPAMLEQLNSGPGAVAVVDNLLGLDHCLAMRREAIAVTEQDLLLGSASAYSTAPPKTFEERYGDEPGISAGVLTQGSRAGDMSPTCRAYITAASKALSRVLGGARRGPVLHDDAKTDHQLRLTTVAQQVHMDNSFDGVNKRLITTLYYLNPDWKPEYGGRFIPWPCSDAEAGNKARDAKLQSTLLAFDELPEESKEQIPPYARDSIRLTISRKLAPSSDYEQLMAQTRQAQRPVEPVGDRLVAFYADELLHSVEPVSLHPLVKDGDNGRVTVHESGRFAVSLWLPAPEVDAILPDNPAQEWLAQLKAPESEDPIGGKLHIDMEKPAARGGGSMLSFGGRGGQGEAATGKKKAGASGGASKVASKKTGFGGGMGGGGGGKAKKKGNK